MFGVRPNSTNANPEPNPAMHPQLQLDQPAEPIMECPIQPSSDCPTTFVFLASDSALQLHLDNFDLLLEPQPTSILQVSLQGHTILLVPEGLQASTRPGHPEFSPTSLLGSPLLDMPRDLVVIEPGCFSASVRDRESLQNASHSGMPWMKAPAGLLPGLHLSSSSFQGQVPDGLSPSVSPSAEGYDPWSNWSLQRSMLEPLPDSPLQPLSPSPPSHQEQCPPSPVRPACPLCKARRRLF
ncbi:proline-rich protein 23A3-like [Arvicanthis niloticus]|uniref:proline-rich protein 23A3-like n=1 Tax=Arvicanthis niloticus TaxID=61156 RepID=UPI00402B59C3